MSLKLRDLIRQVRSCKTAAEERAVIAKESAMIRTAIKEEQEQYRHRNVAKLLFMHMLGYPTHFGQLECMKLIASPHFPEKRIGYLGMMLLLSEEADVLMLATNSLKNDLNSSNKFVAGLALCTIGNLATADMSRDLAPEVEKHLTSSQPYLRKKACLAFSRCILKCADMIEDYVDKFTTLLKDRSHGVLITVVQLMTQVLLLDAEKNGVGAASVCRNAFLKLVPSLVKLLRNLLSVGYSPDHDVGGISDPFLQVQILTLLRFLGTGNDKASEEMNDVLAQVATNTETSKNAGNAILYECVQTIMAIQSEEGLRVLAVNILGRFLLNRDNNIRYVALNTLSRCVVQAGVTDDGGPNSASSALQRHRTTIVDCLKDPDISIRQRALELIYHLVNNENVETLTAELLNYLVLCPREHRVDICTRVLRVVEKYSPDDRWRVDTLITMLTIAGRECNREVLNVAIVYISRASEELRTYATHKLLKAIRDDDGTQKGLLVVGIWCIGEYGDLILKDYDYVPPPTNNADNNNANEESVHISFMALDPTTVVKTVEDVTKRHTCPEEVQELALTCFAKLNDRFANIADEQTVKKLNQLVKKHKGSHSLELQLRSCEYTALISVAKGDVAQEDVTGESTAQDVIAAAKEALSRMPVVDLAVIQRKQKLTGEYKDNTDNTSVLPGGKNSTASNNKSSEAAEPNLLDLNDIFGASPAPAPSAETTIKKPLPKQNGTAKAAKQRKEPEPPKAQSDLDLLSDIFSAPAAPSSILPSDPFAANTLAATPSNDLFAPTPTPTAPPPSPFLSDPLSVAATAPAAVAPPKEPTTNRIKGFTKEGLEIEFECKKPDPFNKQKTLITVHFKNNTDDSLYGLNLQVAVPKYITMEMQPPTSTTIPITGVVGAKQVTQTIHVTNTMLGTKNLMMKVKLGFTSKGNKIEHLETCSGFEAGKY
jgi:AP-1 complex subunit gamma-1